MEGDIIMTGKMANRADLIIKILMAQSGASIKELSEHLGVSEITIRRDLHVLERQGRLTQELKDLKKVKSSLMQNIVEHMDAEEDKETHSRQMDENKRLIEEVKEKIAANEDALLEIPKEIQTCNDALMMETMTFCYDRLRTNCKEAEEIAEWIKKVRVELKKNIIRKQNREINNKEIYAYMHDIFGKDIINLFDVQNDDVDLITGEDRPSGDTTQDKQLSKDVQKGDV